MQASPNGGRARRLAARVVASAALCAAWLPRVLAPVAVPMATAGCWCSESGSAVVFDAETVAREPTIVVDGDACNASSVECVHRDGQDRCDTFWIVPLKRGRCIFAARFSDGTSLEDVIDYEQGSEFLCGTNVHPRVRRTTRLYSKT